MVPVSEIYMAEPTAQTEFPTPLQARVNSCCAELAESFRALQTISGQVAVLLETGNGSPDDLYGLVQAFEQLEKQAGSRLACLGAALSSAGSA